MSTTRHLRDLYRFPGFEPLATLHGVFGDPNAVVLTLRRRRKKRPAGDAVNDCRSSTINGRAGFATSPAATDASISTSPSGAFSAGGVAA
jgi:hypothetical protein